MTLAAILGVAVLSVFASELAGRGRVIYGRVLGLAFSFLLFNGLALAWLARAGTSPAGLAAVFAATLPLMVAWIGLRIHLSNSITLCLLGLLAQEEGRTYEALEAAYDVKGRAAKRVAELRQAGYLDEQGDLRSGLKPRLVFLLISVLRKA